MLEKYSLVFEHHPWVVTVLGIIILVISTLVINIFAKKIILKISKRAINHSSYINGLNIREIILDVVNVIPATVILWGIKLIPGIPDSAEHIINNISTGFIVFILAITFNSALNIVNTLYARLPNSKSYPIKGYIQLAQIVVYIITSILIIAILIDRSPVILLSSLGAVAALLLLVFQDTLLSFVASLQISSADMLRVGDWVEIPNLNVDGEVIDIALHTVKIQNWDNTIATVPTRKFITDSFKNWRGMQESGGRRIKMAVYINHNTIRYLTSLEINNLINLEMVKDYFIEKGINLSNQEAIKSVNILNVEIFCVFIRNYLKAHLSIHKQMTNIVRFLSSGATGLPIEIYCFTSVTDWEMYETVKDDILNQIFATLPAFGLEIFQNPSGTDVRSLSFGNS